MSKLHVNPAGIVPGVMVVDGITVVDVGWAAAGERVHC